MKEYLNSQEVFTVMKFGRLLSDLENELIADWDKRGNITKAERKNLKMSLAFGLKAFESILLRQDYKTQNKIIKNAEQVYVRLVDGYAEKKLEQLLNEKITKARDIEFRLTDFLEIAFYMNCRNCTNEPIKCHLYNKCCEYDIEEFSGDFEGKKCRYAYVGKDLEVEHNRND